VIDPPARVDPDDPLSQPTRGRLFALLGELKRPATTAELAERLELHPNGVRLHLERLERAALVERANLRRGPGRPPDAWTIAADARPGGEPPRAYHDLARWLARAIQARSTSLPSVEHTARQIGRELAPSDATADAGTLHTTLTALGFQPAIAREEDDRVTICLRNCPCRDAVHENQPAICTLHKGITDGLLDIFEPGATLAAFTPHDPDQAGCVIDVRGLAEPAHAN
jgi:predicted ArsR family transcriptional regulator